MATLGGFGDAYRTGRGIAADINSNQFNRLAGLAVTSRGEERDSLLGQLTGLDPARGMAMGDKLKAREGDKRRKLAGAAKYMLGAVESKNPAAVQGAWRTVRPFLEELVGPQGKVVPEQWSDDMLPALHQAIAAAGGTAGGDANVQSRFVDAQGNVKALMRDGTVIDLGVKADPQRWFRDQPGMAPTIVDEHGGVGQVGLQARPSAAQEAGAAERARQAAQIAYLPTRQAIETEGAIDRAQGIAAAEAEVQGKTKQAERNLAFDQYQAAMESLGSGFSGTTTGPIAGRLPAVTAEQQIAEGGVAAMAPILKSLFRTAGEGTFTDKDQELLMNMLPTRKDHPEARKVKMQMIDQIVRAKLGQPASTATRPAPDAQPPAGVDDLLQKYGAR